MREEAVAIQANGQPQKRKTVTSTAVKARYNKKAYSQILVQVPKDTATAFREKCVNEGVSQAMIIKKAIEQFLK